MKLPTWLPVAAWANAITHVVASLAMVVWLLPGLPDGTTTLAERHTYVTEHAAAWSGGWLSWHPAGIALIATLAALWLGARRAEVGRLRWLWHSSIAAGLCGLGCDLAGQWAFILSSGNVPPMQYSALETLGVELTGIAANGLYTAAFVGAAVLTGRSWSVPTRVLGGAVVIAGTLLSLAVWQNIVILQMVATAALMPSVVVWSALLALRPVDA